MKPRSVGRFSLSVKIEDEASGLVDIVTKELFVKVFLYLNRKQ